MFDWLFGKKAPTGPVVRDRVWVDLDARDRAVVRAAREGTGVVVTCFEETRERLRTRLAEAGVEGVKVVLADGPLPSDGELLVAERHPDPGADRALWERLLQERPGLVPVAFCALDDPLMKRFGGDRTAVLMRQLGMEPDEPVEHAMVSQALAKAREKVGARVGAVGAVARTRSMEEWFRLYLPGNLA